MENFLHYSEEI